MSRNHVRVLGPGAVGAGFERNDEVLPLLDSVQPSLGDESGQGVPGRSAFAEHVVPVFVAKIRFPFAARVVVLQTWIADSRVQEWCRRRPSTPLGNFWCGSLVRERRTKCHTRPTNGKEEG